MGQRKRRRHKGKSKVSKKMRRLVERAIALDYKARTESYIINVENAQTRESLDIEMARVEREAKHNERMAGEAKRDLMSAIADLEENLKARLYGRNIKLKFADDQINSALDVLYPRS